jgi:predicted metal-binding protein
MLIFNDLTGFFYCAILNITIFCEVNKLMNKYIDRALKMGATDAVPFKLEDICFDSRTLLKCMFGCSDWGKNHTCPSRPNNASIAEYKQMLSNYSRGIIIHTHDKRLSQDISLAIEGEAYRDGYYFAFSLSDCGLCTSCTAIDNLPCRNPKKARPSFHSVGIDVFKTVRGLGLPINTLTDPDTEEQNWYSAVFIE